ncbi:MAG TPA: extracellular solute-binding protein [Chloroflexota bacterium]|nr:extracellular solute-binding protein [Chloroflexota bacterium]
MRLIPAIAAVVIMVACGSQAGAPGGTGGASNGQAQQTSEWDRVLAEAKKEGSVNVIGLEGVNTQEALTAGFEREYGIHVEFLPDAGPGVGPRVSNERSAGQYLWDVYVLGTTTALNAMFPMGAFDPIDQALIRDDVKDPKNWRGGDIEYLDPEHRLIIMTPFQRGTLFINPSIVQPGEIKSYKDLLDPKWRGKMVMNDPRRAGPGLATFTFFYLHPDLGPDFIRALGRQDITILSNFQQEVDSVGQGRYSILIGTADAIAEERIRQGIPIQIMDVRQIREGSDVSPANGALAIFNRAPHPNAAKVYVNWLLSKEGQTDFARASGYVSARLDVPTDHALPWRVPAPGAIKTYDLKAVGLRDQVISLVEEVFGPA